MQFNAKGKDMREVRIIQTKMIHLNTLAIPNVFTVNNLHFILIIFNPSLAIIHHIGKATTSSHWHIQINIEPFGLEQTTTVDVRVSPLSVVISSNRGSRK